MKTKRHHLTKSGDLEVVFVDSDVLETYDKLALEALGSCRASIMMAARFLNAALWRLPFNRQPLSRTISVGGREMQYDPENVVERYRLDPNELVRDCLHAVLHCVFHHPFDKRHDEFDTWSLACDIAVELCALDLCGDRFACPGDADRLNEAKRLKGIARNLTAPALYQVLAHGGPGDQLYADKGITDADIRNFRDLFTRDLHDLWASRPHAVPEQKNQGESAAVPDMQAQGSGESQEAAQAPDAGEFEGGAADFESLDGDMADRDVHEEWKKISKQVEAELRSQRNRGTGDGTLLINLSVANKKPADYDSFLRRFASLAEDMRVNDDEFDYIFYTYGLNRYGNVPLVEPLEYMESNRVREFVIAIDTSGSCSGRLVREFVERTYAILRQRASFSSEINVHIVQCDKEIKTATKVTSLRQLEEYRDSFWVSGGGGTDFRPVFSYVDSLVENGEFNDLRGLVYFTDGYGSFPTRAPDYDVAFVFVDQEGMNVRVPPWAMKVIMTRDEIVEAGDHVKAAMRGER